MAEKKKAVGAADPGKTRTLTTFMLAMINVAAVLGISKLPAMAVYGTSAIFFIGFAAIVFFVPMSLVSAELATAFAGSNGGIYAWVREAFGKRWGFLAIWLQWFSDTVSYPVLLSSASAGLAFVFFPQLGENPMYTFVAILAAVWAITLINFKGMKLSGWISTLFATCGTILPGALLILLGGLWVVGGKPIEIDPSQIIPTKADMGVLVFLTSIFLGFCGMEMSAVHARDVKDPQKNYPRAILISALIVIAIYALGSLAIAIVVPKSEIMLNAGIIQAAGALVPPELSFLLPLLPILLAIGAIGTLNAWISGPSRGLLQTAEDGVLPKFFQKANEDGVPVNILVTQGVCGTLLASVFLFTTSANLAFTVLLALAAQIYLLMYILMFAAAIKLRYSRSDLPRAFSVPGGKIGIWIVCLVGILAALFAIFIGFRPPSGFEAMTKLGEWEFRIFLLVGLALICGAPLLLVKGKEGAEKEQSERPKPRQTES